MKSTTNSAWINRQEYQSVCYTNRVQPGRIREECCCVANSAMSRQRHNSFHRFWNDRTFAVPRLSIRTLTKCTEDSVAAKICKNNRISDLQRWTTGAHRRPSDDLWLQAQWRAGTQIANFCREMLGQTWGPWPKVLPDISVANKTAGKCSASPRRAPFLTTPFRWLDPLGVPCVTPLLPVLQSASRAL